MKTFTPKLEAYKKITDTLSERQRTVLNAIKEIQPSTYQEITKHLKTTTNNSTSRMTELKAMGLICSAGTTRKFGNVRDLFRVCTEDEVIENQKILLELYQKEKAEFESDLEKYPTLKESTKRHLKLRISNLKTKISRINRCGLNAD